MIQKIKISYNKNISLIDSTLLGLLILLIGSFTPNNLLLTVQKIGCCTHCFQRSAASPIGQSGANLFDNYLV